MELYIMVGKYRLGVDVGTSSLGLVAYELATDSQGKLVYEKDEKDKTSPDPKVLNICHMDTVIFREPIEPKRKTLLNLARREARSHRRLLDRTKRRKKKLFHLYKTFRQYETSKTGTELDTLAKKEWNAVNPEDIFMLRAKAVDTKISLNELFKVLFHLSQNRGYKGDLRSSGVVSKGIEATEKLFDEKGVKTLGQLYAKLQQENINTSKQWKILTNNKDPQGTYIKREHIVDEFNLIMDEQSKHHKILLKPFTEVGGDLKYYLKSRHSAINTCQDAIYEAIFFQRPIKWDKESIKKCDLTNEIVAAQVSLTYQKWRIETRLNNLRWVLPKDVNTPKQKQQLTQPLTADEKDKLRGILNSKAWISFADIYKELEVPDCHFSDDRSAKSGEDRGLVGNKTLAFFNSVNNQKDPAFKEAVKLWEELTFNEKEAALQYLSLLSSTDELYQDEDDIVVNIKEFTQITAVENLNKILNFINTFKEYEKFNLLPKMVVDSSVAKLGVRLANLDGSRANYSISAMQKMLPYIEKGEKEYDAKKIAFPEEKNTKKFKEIIKDITNPIVKRSLKELKKALDYTYHKMGGKPERITIELSREMKTPPSERGNIESKNNTREALRSKYKNELIKLGIEVNSSNIKKYTLWEDQGKKCSYTGDVINVENFYKCEIDHIIPKKQGGGNALYNLVLTTQDLNNKKTDYTPFQAYKKGIMTDDNWKHINNLANDYKKSKDETLKRKAKLLITEKAGEGIDEHFMERANTETAFIGRVLLNWLQSEYNFKDDEVKDKILVSRGKLTAHLRDFWGLNELLEEIRFEENKPLVALVNNKEEFLNYYTLRKYKELKKEAKDSNWSEEKKQQLIGFYKEHKIKDPAKELAFYKRADHRHHLIDAAIIGLTTRSMLQKASTIYAKSYGTLKALHKKDTGEVISEGFYPDCSLKQDKGEFLKNLLKQKLINYVVWQKPDRHPNLELFKESACALEKNTTLQDSQKRLISRTDLSSFGSKNFEDVKASLEKKIVGKDIKESIIQQFTERYARLSLENESKQKIDQRKVEDIIKIALIGEENNIDDGIFFPKHLKKNKVKKVKVYFTVKGEVKYNPKADLYKASTNTVYRGAGYSCARLKKDGTAEPITRLQSAKLQAEHSLVNNEESQYIYPNDLVFNKENKEFYMVASFNNKQGIKMKLSTEPFSFDTYGKINTLIIDYLKKNKEQQDDTYKYYKNLKNKEFYKIVGWSKAGCLIPISNREDIIKIKKQYIN